MAYRVYNTSRLRPGTTARASEVLAQMRDLALESGALSVRAFMVDVGGDATGLLVGEFEFESMVHWAQWRDRVSRDTDYQQLGAQMVGEVMEPGSMRIAGAAELLTG